MKCSMLHRGDGLRITMCACYYWGTTCRAGKRWEREEEQEELLVRKFVRQMMTFPTEFSTGVTLVKININKGINKAQ
jgi:hypothetical protein